MARFPFDRRQILVAGALTPFVPALAARGGKGGGGDSPTAFANREIAAAGAGAPAVSYRIDPGLGAQCYSFRGSRDAVVVTAGDATGAMYAGLDIAEAVRTGGDAIKALVVDPKVRKPYVAQRGIKFNIPLDLRTPSYSDGADSARANIPEVWDRDFWVAYLDEMARFRYNVLTLWSMHPFPSMVKVPEYRDVALNDVWRSREPLGPDIFDGRGRKAVMPKFLDNHEIVKKINIDEKIAFWRDVMTMAQNRGITVYIFTWNVFTYGTFGKYGIDDSIHNATTIAYMRASVRELIKTYPLLAGIGITAGENMGDDTSSEDKEKWLWATYGEGVRDALKAQPGRHVHLIHRFHETAGDTINRVWKDYPGFPDSFTFSHKYSVAHMYSNARPQFFEREARPSLRGKQSWLTVRNDDIYSLRWGDPDFAREYITNMPKPPALAGFYMGPDGYCWGRDFLDRADAGKNLGRNRPLVMQKHWYSFTLWGRLAYDPTLPDTQFKAMLAVRYPGVDADRLFAAARFASQVIPRTTCFFWRDIDIRWLPEACAHHSGNGIKPKDDKVGAVFYTVADFMIGETAPDVGILNIRQWRKKLADGAPLVQRSPLDAADDVGGAGEQALELIADIRRAMPNPGSRDLQQTIGDFEAMGHLGRYYAAKIRGASELALFDADGDPAHKEVAVRHLQDALVSWKDYAAIHSAQYLPNFFARLAFVDISAMTADVVKDIEIARSWKAGTLA
ncbi:MAG TPA: hypothetical protein VNT42_14350 [Sphingomonas sp.]|nr:hypothetical protein [Sphingomonas sp.]